jgi:hypothetical protein
MKAVYYSAFLSESSLIIHTLSHLVLCYSTYGFLAQVGLDSEGDALGLGVLTGYR